MKGRILIPDAQDDSQALESMFRRINRGIWESVLASVALAALAQVMLWKAPPSDTPPDAGAMVVSHKADVAAERGDFDLSRRHTSDHVTVVSSR